MTHRPTAVVRPPRGRRAPRALALALALLAAPAALRAEDDPLAGLSGADILAVVKDLASDAMKGRKTGFEGGRLADDYVAQAMGEIGLDPKDPAGSYLDPFEFEATQVRGPVTLALDGAPVAYGTDVVDLIGTGGGDVAGEVVFVGYGISAPDRGYDDYAGLDVKGRIVMAIRGAPAARAADLVEERQIGRKSTLARERGAVGFLLCEGDRPVVGTVQARFLRKDLPALSLSRAAADRVLAKAKTTLADERTRRDAARQALPALATGVRAALRVDVEHKPRAQGHNALGAIRGTDPDLRGEVLLVGAHMDHLGVDALGRVYNGADDNASGTAVLLTLARTLVNNGWRPRRTVLFVAFGAEEQGLVGSRHLAEGLPFENDGIVCALVLDMAGQGGTDVSLVGGERFPAMGERLLAALPEALRAKVDPKGATEPSGDHWPFAAKGVPAFALATKGEHPGYHTVDDDVERIQPASLEAAARVLGALIVRLGESPERLVAPAAPR